MTEQISDAPSAPSQPPKLSPSFAWSNIAGGGLFAVGSLLPWISATSIFGTISKSGLDGGGDGAITLIAGAVIAVFGFTALSHRVSTGLRIAAVVATAISGLIAIMEMDYVQRRLATFPTSPYATATAGAGVYVLLVGAGVAFLGSVASGWDSPAPVVKS